MNFVKLLVVIVIYNETITETKTYSSFIKSIISGNLSNNIELMIYDNSIESQQNIILTTPFNTMYIHDPSNGGLSKAYNCALSYANDQNMDWLLLLDQDSELSFSFIETLLKNIKKVQNDEHIAAIVPKVFANNIVISPFFIGLGGTFKQISHFDFIYNDSEVGAINSGSLIRVSFLQAIGGFNQTLWLDMLDLWLFHEIYLYDKKILVTSNPINHNLSVLDYSTISYQRYNNIITSENYFYRYHKGFYDLFFFKLRLFCRFTKQVIVRRRLSIALLTFRRIFW
jgi:GT2 family glycosyltransferase